MSRFIILVEREPNIVIPIVNGEDETMDGCLAIFPTREAAQACSDQTLLCRAYGADIIDLDDLP